MSPLAYQKIDEIKDMLGEVELENLVAVFSQARKPGYLFVYYDTPLTPLSPRVQVVPLSDLPDLGLSDFDGPVVGFSALDVIRPDVLTKGPSFYAIERLFLDRGLQAALHRTMRNLACYLADYLTTLPTDHEAMLYRRGVSKVLQLSLPAVAASRTGNLVAAVPGRDLHRVASGEDWRLIHDDLSQLDDLNGLDVHGRDWVVAVDEMHLFQPELDPQAEHFLELRDVFRIAGLDEALQNTCRTLAWRCYTRAETGMDFLEAAVSLMAEAWLSTQDTEDLAAFFPHSNFTHFAETGDGLRVYRRFSAREVPLANGSGLSWSLAELAKSKVPSNYSQFVLSLLPQLALSDRARDTAWLDLGPVLSKAGQGRSLAKTLWLLAADGLRMAPADRDRLGLTADVLVDLAIRSVILHSLDDPWQWRQGRYDQNLAGCYRTLHQAIEFHAPSAQGRLAAYCDSLNLWFGCYGADSEGIRTNLEEMTRLLKGFLRASQDHSNEREALTICHTEAERLIRIEEVVLHPFIGFSASRSLDHYAQAETDLPPTGVPRILRVASSRQESSGRLSPFLERAWKTFVALRDERRRVQESLERDVEALLRELQRLNGNLKHHRDLLFALPHEAAVLRFAYDQEIGEVEKLIGGLEASAILEISLRNPWLDLETEPDLHFEVTNIGRVPATDIEIVLVQTSEFELLEGSSVREIGSLPSGASETFTYPVRPLLPDVTLTLNYTYRDEHDQKQEGSRPFRPEVRNLEPLPFKVKVNRYQFGRPIQEPDDFFGRRAELLDILSLLAAGGKQNVLLRGPRRMGKTSLFYMLQRALEESNTRHSFDVPPEWDPDLDRVRPVLITLQSVAIRDDLTHIDQFFRALLEQICQALGIQPAIAQATVANYTTRSQEIGAATATQEQLEHILGRQRPGRHVVVLLDEYDEVYRPQGRELDIALRTVVSHEQRLTWIIASTLGLYKESKSVGSPWFNVFRIVELGQLSPGAAHDLVVAPSQAERVYWRADAIVSLLRETGLHPAFIQLFCGKLIAYLNQERTNFVLNEAIEASANQIVEEQETAHSHFEFYWSDTNGVGKLILLIVDDSMARLKRTEIRQQVLERLEVAFGERPRRPVEDQAGNPLEWRELQFKDGMDWVEKITNAVSPDEQRRFHFTVPLFRRWLRRRRRQENLESEALDVVRAEMERDGLV
jgi:hypothetical protein